MATNINDEQNLIMKRTVKHILVRDSQTEGLVSSHSVEKTITTYGKDDPPEGRSYTVKHGFNIDKQVIEDQNGVINRVICTKLPYNTEIANLSLDTEKTVFDKEGKRIKKEILDINGSPKIVKQYFYNGDTLERCVVKDNYTVTTFLYDQYGNCIERSGETIASKTKSKDFVAEFEPGEEHNLISIKMYSKGLVTTASCRYDDNKRVIERTLLTKKMFDDRRVVETLRTCYDPNHDYKVCRIERNGKLIEQYQYNSEGEVIYMFLKQGEVTKSTRMTSEVDPETGNKKITRVDYITLEDGTQKTETSVRTYDQNKNLLVNAENGTVTTYTYDENNRRLTAKHEVVFEEKLFTVGEVTYTYDDSDESVQKVTREQKSYDLEGNVTFTKKDITTISELREERFEEFCKYDTPGNSEQE